MGVAGRDADEEGRSVRVRQDASWKPGCPGPRGSGLCVRPPFFCPDGGGVQDDAGDVDEAGIVEVVRARMVKASRHAPSLGHAPSVGVLANVLSCVHVNVPTELWLGEAATGCGVGLRG